MLDSEKVPRRRFELWGESIRELGVLLLVFVPLDVVVDAMKDSNLSFWEAVAKHPVLITTWGVIGFLLMIIGVEIERR